MHRTRKIERKSVLPVYDGNGNIMSYLNASTKAPVAEYVYDAFGRTISSNGTEADNFTYRFSTKPMDGSGLTTTVIVITIRNMEDGSAVIRLRKMAV